MSESHGSWSSEAIVLGIEEVSVVRMVVRGMEKRVSSSAMFSLATWRRVSMVVRVVVRCGHRTNTSSGTLIPHIDQIDLLGDSGAACA